jgi:hypothetical protein
LKEKETAELAVKTLEDEKKKAEEAKLAAEVDQKKAEDSLKTRMDEFNALEVIEDILVYINCLT